MKREYYYRGRPGAKYGIWNGMKKCFQFAICEDTPMLAEARLYQKIGADASKHRFEPRELPARFAAVFSELKDLLGWKGAPIWFVCQDVPEFYPETNGWYISSQSEIAEVCTEGFWEGKGPAEGGEFYTWSVIGKNAFLTNAEARRALEKKVAEGETFYE